VLVIDESEREQFYQALLDRESRYVGVFFVAVKTTWVFCIATCRARKPKFKNVEFYTCFKEALDCGYRPCKVCKPTENTHQAPVEVQAAISLVRDNPKQKFSDAHLAESGFNPVNLRRWFKQHYGMTFQAFQRMYRINNALLELKSGKTVTDCAFASGYESLSGFGYTYKKVLKQSPNENKEQCTILINRLTTPLGPMFICATDNGICLLEFVDHKQLERKLEEIQFLLSSKIIAGENKIIRQAKKQLSEYFSGLRQHFDLSIDMRGSKYERQVWQYLMSVPYGQAISDQQKGSMLHSKNSPGVGLKAIVSNKIAIIIPSHRVVTSNEKLKGREAKTVREQWLLEQERKNVEQANS
jgi:AraC family transcriptional regulator of adaptative response/methylated-DNA-[protein]-cysteine methyltransferase